jgi:hypothetical protein
MTKPTHAHIVCAKQGEPTFDYTCRAISTHDVVKGVVDALKADGFTRVWVPAHSQKDDTARTWTLARGEGPAIATVSVLFCQKEECRLGGLGFGPFIDSPEVSK